MKCQAVVDNFNAKASMARKLGFKATDDVHELSPCHTVHVCC